MTKEKTEKKTPRPRYHFHFRDRQHLELVMAAADKAGLSMNAWIVVATLAKARKDLAEK